MANVNQANLINRDNSGPAQAEPLPPPPAYTNRAFGEENANAPVIANNQTLTNQQGVPLDRPRSGARLRSAKVAPVLEQTQLPLTAVIGDNNGQRGIGANPAPIIVLETKGLNSTKETVPKKKSCCTFLDFPISVYFIIINEACERFSFYGMKAILVLFFKSVSPAGLGMDDATATAVYHAFVMICYLTPILGGIIADTWIGKFWTIVILSLVYAVGNVGLSVASFPLPANLLGSMGGLLLIALGTGGIKPCVSSFGADQFGKEPEDDLKRSRFFSIFYFTINFGSFLSTFITPILRAQVQCFGATNCFPLAFGVPAILMVAAVIIFVIGTKWYKRNPPQGNILVKVSLCIGRAIKNYFKRDKNEPKKPLLDYASDKYDLQFISEVRRVLFVLLLFLPVPIFWALFDQKGSRWTIQATKMNNHIAGDVYLLPDQMQIINPLLILIFIPLFQSVIYPLLAKCNVLTNKRLPHRMVVGGILAALSFVIAGLVQMAIDPTQPMPVSSDEVQIKILNLAPDCSFTEGSFNYKFLEMGGVRRVQAEQANEFWRVNLNCISTVPVPVVATFSLTTLGIAVTKTFSLNTTATPSPRIISLEMNISKELLRGGNEMRLAVSYIEANGQGYAAANLLSVQNKKAEGGDSYVRYVSLLPESLNRQNFTLRTKRVDGDVPRNGEFILPAGLISSTDYKAIGRAEYDVELRAFNGGGLIRSKSRAFSLQNGAAATYVLYADGQTATNATEIKNFEDMPPNTVSILWLLPQYVLITLGEVLYSVSGLEFAYQQAPASMKSLLSAAWLLTTAAGNAIVLIVAEARLLEQMWEFFLFAILMFVDVIIFLVIAIFYKYQDEEEKEKENSKALEKEKEIELTSRALTSGASAGPEVVTGESKTETTKI